MVYITLNRNNFFDNLDIIAKQTKDKNKIALVLKDNAYGHGLLEIATLAKEYGITKAVVRSNEEAKEIEDFFEYVLVLADIPAMPSRKIRYTINDIKTITKFPKGTLVELKVDTGMGRNGIEMFELSIALKNIETQGLKLEAIFTHHSCADELNGNYEIQVENFETIKQHAPEGVRFHSCNSAALFRENDFSEDMARVGIAAYGCLQLPKEIASVSVKPVLSVYANRISGRLIYEGSRVGYGGSLIEQDSGIVSNYDFGYGDGFFRSCSNIYKTPQGVAIAGRVSMDNSSFISDEEELLIFNDAREVAKVANTISYEVLTSLKSYIKRVVT